HGEESGHGIFRPGSVEENHLECDQTQSDPWRHFARAKCVVWYHNRCYSFGGSTGGEFPDELAIRSTRSSLPPFVARHNARSDGKRLEDRIFQFDPRYRST